MENYWLTKVHTIFATRLSRRPSWFESTWRLGPSPTIVPFSKASRYAKTAARSLSFLGWHSECFHCSRSVRLHTLSSRSFMTQELRASNRTRKWRKYNKSWLKIKLAPSLAKHYICFENYLGENCLEKKFDDHQTLPNEKAKTEEDNNSEPSAIHL